MQHLFRSLTLTMLLLAVPSLAAAAGEPRPGNLPADQVAGELKVVSLDGKTAGEALRLPLEHTDVEIEVSGFVARAKVRQRYTNPFDKPIEAVYVFPLPNKAAVDGMTMTIGEKVIRGQINKRAEARRIYERAVAAGKRAGLLEQERPNIFTQSVGNILPGDRIEIEITYVDILDYRDEGAFELVFPMVVGPRYIPGQTLNEQGSQSGDGTVADTDQVPDAARITPPVLEPGQRSGHDISLSVKLDAAVPIRALHSISHAVDTEQHSPSRRTVRLHASDQIPNKDFVLRYQVAGKAPQVALITHKDGQRDGFFTLVVLPQQQVTDAQTVPRDLIFILDTSGSMRGEPLAKSKDAMQRLIQGMRPSDRFNIVRFAGDTSTLWSQPRPKTSQNLAAALAYVERQRGSGGTEMRSGIVEALAQPSDPERLRIAMLLTDGYVGNEQGILAAIEKERRGARVFSLGVGSSVNRFLLDRVATVGLGEAFYLRQDEQSDETIARFFKRVDRPSLAHIALDWGNLSVTGLTPARIPDLWQGQPILVHGRYARGEQGELVVRGRIGAEPYEKRIPVQLPAKEPANGALASVWARSRVKELMLSLARGASPQAVEGQVTKLGLDYGLMTQWTSFVAVEETIVNQDGKPTKVVQPLELPEGVDYEGVFGERQKNAHAARLMLVAPSPMMQRSAGHDGRVRRRAPTAGRFHNMAPMAEAPAADYAVAEESEPKQTAEIKETVSDGAPAEPAAPGESLTYRCLPEALTVSGELRYADVRRILVQHLKRLCPALQGAVDRDRSLGVRLLVGEDGKPSSVKLDTPRGFPQALAARIRQSLQTLVFTPLKHGGEVSISFDLKLATP